MKKTTCTKCGLACFSTWKSILPITCKACKLREKKALGDHPQHHGLARGAQSLEITSPLQQRVSRNERTTTLHGGIREPNLELSLSLPQGDQETNVENKIANNEKSSSLWNPRGMQKRKRSKLPQYTLSLNRFANQLRQATGCQKMKGISANDGRCYILREKPKYDDVLIYEKCKLISHNEIGLGAVLLSPPVSSTKGSNSELVQVKTEPAPYTDGDCVSSSSVLFEVPIRGLSE